jgi:hypothetical protein
MKWIPDITKFKSLILDMINKNKAICIAKDFIMYFQKNCFKIFRKDQHIMSILFKYNNKANRGGKDLFYWLQNLKIHTAFNHKWVSLSLRGLSLRANYTDRAAAAGRQSYC